MKHYKLEGHEIVECDLLESARFLEYGDRIVKQETIDDVKVSTVFLGIDHNFIGGKPILFETMIFGGKYDDFQCRYCTWDEAEAGHEEVVRMVRAS